MDWGEQVMKDVDKNIAYKIWRLMTSMGIGVYAVAFGVFLLIGKLTGEWGLTGSLESLFETTFFIPAYLC